jgi:hypothetical protein
MAAVPRLGLEWRGRETVQPHQVRYQPGAVYNTVGSQMGSAVPTGRCPMSLALRCPCLVLECRCEGWDVGFRVYASRVEQPGKKEAGRGDDDRTK